MAPFNRDSIDERINEQLIASILSLTDQPQMGHPLEALSEDLMILRRILRSRKVFWMKKD